MPCYKNWRLGLKLNNQNAFNEVDISISVQVVILISKV